MKSLVKLFMILFTLIECQNLRNLILEDIERYNKLTSVASQVMNQIYNFTVDFNSKTRKDYETEKYKISIQISESQDQSPPPYNHTIISIDDGIATFEDELNIPKDINLELIGTKHTLKEQLLILGESIAHAYDLESVKGSIIIYKSEDINNVKAQSRFRLMVKSTDDKKIYGWAEVVQEDLNDGKKIINFIKKYYNKVKELIGIIQPELKLWSEFASTTAGILADFNKKNDDSLFLSMKYLSIVSLILLF